jgi:hypothetical protein
VGASSYHVYRSTPPPAPARVFAPTVPKTPPFLYQPMAKKARTSTSEKQQAQEPHAPEQGGSVAVSTEPVASGSGGAQPPPPSTSTTTMTKRKRPSHAATTPPQSLPQPLTSPFPYPNAPSPQYPYTYYVPPYGMPPYGMPLPPPPASTSSTSASPPISAQQPSTSSYPYYYPYHHPYGPPPPGYIYAPPGYVPAPYTQSQTQQPQPYAPQSLQPGTYPLPYGYPKDTARFGYTHQPPQPPQLEEYSFVV